MLKRNSTINGDVYLTNQPRTIEKPKTIFLFGAGASRPAGIPTITEMTKEFIDDPNLIKGHDEIPQDYDADIKKSIKQLTEIVQQHYGNMDLELMMSFILDLEDEKLKTMFEKQYPFLAQLTKQNEFTVGTPISDIKNLIQNFVREKCEDIKTTEYLWAFKGLVEHNPINIFSLNYDGTIEIFCETNGIKYTDGFEPFWDQNNFDKGSEINLFKLHGSLYWLRNQSGKSMKIPIKGLRTDSIKYLTNESMHEMLIYPALRKSKQLVVYSWLNQKFKDELQNSDVCVIIGYSFRDEDITESIIEALGTNQNLWIVIVNPSATDLKNKIFSDHDDVSSRIVVMNRTTEEALGDRALFPFLSKLDSASKSEKKAWISQSTNQTRDDYSYWKNIIYNYLEIDHEDHVKWILEELRSKKFTDVHGNFPETIEGVISPRSFRYALEYHKKGNVNKSEFWKKIFLESCLILEYMTFKTGGDILQQSNPVVRNELPKSYNEGARYSMTDTIEKMQDELLIMEKNITDKKMQDSMKGLIQTLKILTRKKEKTEGGWIMYSETEMVDNYKNHDLGLKKWAIELVNLLK